MTPSYECQSCHAIQEEPDGLCVPVHVHNECLTPTNLRINLGNACEGVMRRAAFFCEGCGRPTGEPQNVCMPVVLQG